MSSATCTAARAVTLAVLLAACGSAPQSGAGNGGYGGGATGGIGGDGTGVSGAGGAQGGIDGAGTAGVREDGSADSAGGTSGASGTGATGARGGAGGTEPVAGTSGTGGASGRGGTTGPACTPGDHKSCNEDPVYSGTRGTCRPDAVCNCSTTLKSRYTGRCLAPGSDGTGCEYAGATYVVSAVVPVLGCADRCSCAAPGTISCPPSACVPCTFGEDYTFRLPGGPDGSFARSLSTVAFRRLPSGSDFWITCGVPLPRCDTPGVIDASDIIADIANADVQTALATMPAPTYGDRAVTSPPTFTFSGQGGSFSIIVGHECPTATATCDVTPGGIARLVADINSVASAALADPACSNVR